MKEQISEELAFNIVNCIEQHLSKITITQIGKIELVERLKEEGFINIVLKSCPFCGGEAERSGGKNVFCDDNICPIYEVVMKIDRWQIRS